MKTDEPLEIERKFLIRYPEPEMLERMCGGKADMRQIYLKSEKGISRRVRRTEKPGKTEYWYNEKTRISDTTRIEKERIVSEDEYQELLKEADPEYSMITKTRYYLYYGKYCFEIDIFPEWSDRAIMEVELEDENAEVDFPESIKIIKEVTSDSRYTNLALARNGFVKEHLIMTEYEQYLTFAKDIAQEAGRVMKKYFNRNDISSFKGDKTIVTLADTEINSYLIRRVKESFPDHCVDGEEEQSGQSRFVWVCDPVDGTAMFARHIPVAVFSLALAIDGVPVVGVVFDVFTDNLYYAVQGKGAYRNEERIHVNDHDCLDVKDVSNCDMWPQAGYDMCPVIQELWQQAYLVNLGSSIRSGICVAGGEFTFSLFPGTVHKNCDMAALKILVEEAGGKVTDLFGNEQRYDRDINGAVISNGRIHDKLISIIKKHLTDRHFQQV